MIHLWAVALMLAPGGISVEGAAGFGGLDWETNAQPKINSAAAVCFGVKYEFSKNWITGIELNFNAYDGDGVWHVGPGMLNLHASIGRIIPMEDFTLHLGVGIASGLLFSKRNLLEPDGDYPAGRYSYITAGLLVGVNLAIMRTIATGIRVGFSLKYFLGAFLDRCFEGPARDCREVDRQQESWTVHFVVAYDL